MIKFKLTYLSYQILIKAQILQIFHLNCWCLLQMTLKPVKSLNLLNLVHRLLKLVFMDVFILFFLPFSTQDLRYKAYLHHLLSLHFLFKETFLPYLTFSFMNMYLMELIHLFLFLSLYFLFVIQYVISLMSPIHKVNHICLIFTFLRINLNFS